VWPPKRRKKEDRWDARVLGGSRGRASREEELEGAKALRRVWKSSEGVVESGGERGGGRGGGGGGVL